MCFNCIDRLNSFLFYRGDRVIDRVYKPYKTELYEDANISKEMAILEIGAGAGANFKYLPAGVSVKTVEPNRRMHPALKKVAAKHEIKVEFFDDSAETLPLSDESIDLVISSLVFCTISDPIAALQEAKRVLKPGGRMIFVEHIVSREGATFQLYQKVCSPIWKTLFGGCRLRQDTRQLLEGSGFNKIQIDEFRLTSLAPFAPHVYGWLEK
jgi:ubiquinone/menaquinone biosynthesis C-methylase UbiE